MSATPPERLNRFLARRGVASRRGADTLIADGRVTVNGELAAEATLMCKMVDLDSDAVPAADSVEKAR